MVGTAGGLLGVSKSIANGVVATMCVDVSVTSEKPLINVSIKSKFALVIVPQLPASVPEVIFPIPMLVV